MADIIVEGPGDRVVKLALPEPYSLYLVLPGTTADVFWHYKRTHRHTDTGMEYAVYVFDHAQGHPGFPAREQGLLDEDETTSSGMASSPMSTVQPPVHATEDAPALSAVDVPSRVPRRSR